MSKTFDRGDHVTTKEGWRGVVLMPETPGWDRLTVLVAPGARLPYQRDYYAHELTAKE